MKKPTNLLCIEDHPLHVGDLEKVLASEIRLLPMKVNVLHAHDMETAERFFPEADLCMLSPRFPTVSGHHEEDHGMTVIDRCLAIPIKPFVWVTNFYTDLGPEQTDRLPLKMAALNRWGREKGFEMFDGSFVAQPSAERVFQAGHKPWQAALCALFYLAVGIQMGICEVKDGKLVDIEKGRAFRLRCTNPFARLEKFMPGQNKDHILAEMVKLGFPHKIFTPPSIVGTGDDVETTSTS